MSYHNPEVSLIGDTCCSSLLGERINPTGYCPIDRESEVPTVERPYPRTRERAAITDVNARAARSPQLF